MADSKPLAVVLLSGGMDSLVAAKLATDRHRIALFHLNYGQRTMEAEMRAFTAIANHFGVTHTLLAHSNLYRQIGGSALTDDAIAVPLGEPGGKEIPVTYVPFRNGLLLSMAAAWAEVLGAKRIIYGAVQVDGPGYPDCREVFVNAMAKAVKAGTKPQSGIEIEAPLINLTKEAVVRLGAEYHLPFELTWSCYDRNDIHCGVCASCELRRKGFATAGIADPTEYAPEKAIRDARDQRKIERLKILLKALVKPEAA